MCYIHVLIKVQGSRFRVQGSGFKVQGSGFKVKIKSVRFEAII
jgi:hypothetical protein